MKRFPKQISSQNDSLYLFTSSSPTESLDELFNLHSGLVNRQLTVVVELVVLGPPVPIMLVLVVEAGAPEHGPSPAAFLGLHLLPEDDQS